MPAKKRQSKPDQSSETRADNREQTRIRQELAFEIDSTKAPKLPKSPPGQFTIKVRFRFEASGFDVAANNLESLLARDTVASALFEQAVIRTVVRNIRRRYLASIEKALEMQVLEKNNKPLSGTEQIKTRMRDVRLKASISNTMEKLNEAQMDKDYERADMLRERLTKFNDRLFRQLKKAPDGRRYVSNALSFKTGNIFRQRLIALLNVITDASFVQTTYTAGTLTVGVGPINVVEQIETPSATPALTGMPTSSRYRTFWRHVEFGTGARRKKANNPGGGKPDTWTYGFRKEASLVLRGTEPMNFLFTNSGGMYQEDMDDLASAFTKALDDLLTAK